MSRFARTVVPEESLPTYPQTCMVEGCGNCTDVVFHTRYGHVSRCFPCYEREVAQRKLVELKDAPPAVIDHWKRKAFGPPSRVIHSREGD